jgi:hypothetical protein
MFRTTKYLPNLPYPSPGLIDYLNLHTHGLARACSRFGKFPFEFNTSILNILTDLWKPNQDIARLFFISLLITKAKGKIINCILNFSFLNMCVIETG